MLDYEDGLLPGIVDAQAALEPDKLYGAFATGVGADQNITKVSYSRLANAVNRLAWFLEETFGKSTTYETIAYVGPSDFRYPLVALAASKTGHQAQFISWVNALPAQLMLLESSKCKKFMIAEDFESFMPAADAILAKREMQKVLLQPVDHWLQLEPAKAYPFDAKLSDDPRRPFVVLHTSGSTGWPEPITYHFSALPAYRHYLEPEKVVPGAPETIQSVWRDNCMYMAFPPFHMVGTLCTTALVVYWNQAVLLGPVNVPISVDLATSMVKTDVCTSAVIPPSILQQLVHNETQLESFRKLSHIIWCGAPLSSAEVGEKLRAVVRIYAAYGATEIGPLPLSIEDQAEHEWMSFSPIIGAELRHFTDDLYELVVKKDPKLAKTQFVFRNWPNIDEWAVRDLMSKHPTKEMWRYRGRRDDMIILATGNNINPLMQEGVVMSHPQVTGALLTGSGRATTAWLVETKSPPENEEEKQKALDDIWPVIEKANEVGQAFARAGKEAVIFTTRERPMSRAPKGSLIRGPTVINYEKELASLYEN